MKAVSDKRRTDNNKTLYFMFNNLKKRAVYEMMWKNIVEPARPQMKIWRMRIACWVPKATNTHL
jgi:hypothetical protein